VKKYLVRKYVPQNDAKVCELETIHSNVT